MITENEKLFIEKFKKSDISEWSKIESDPKVRHFVDGKKKHINNQKNILIKIFYPMTRMDWVDMLFVLKKINN